MRKRKILESLVEWKADAVFLTFISGLGFILSIVMLFLNNSEKKQLLLTNQTNEIVKEMKQLKTANIISIINILLTIVLIFILIAILIFFGYLLSSGYGGSNH